MNTPYREGTCDHSNRLIQYSLAEPEAYHWICQDCGKKGTKRRANPYPWKQALLLWAVIFVVSCGIPGLLWLGGGR